MRLGFHVPVHRWRAKAQSIDRRSRSLGLLRVRGHKKWRTYEHASGSGQSPEGQPPDPGPAQNAASNPSPSRAGERHLSGQTRLAVIVGVVSWVCITRLDKVACLQSCRFNLSQPNSSAKQATPYSIGEHPLVTPERKQPQCDARHIARLRLVHPIVCVPRPDLVLGMEPSATRALNAGER